MRLVSWLTGWMNTCLLGGMNGCMDAWIDEIDALVDGWMVDQTFFTLYYNSPLPKQLTVTILHDELTEVFGAIPNKIDRNQIYLVPIPHFLTIPLFLSMVLTISRISVLQFYPFNY